MQWIAMATMLIDHIGLLWFSDSPAWRIVGRLAFPIYAWYVATGMSRTRSKSAYLRRLALLAAVSQVPYSLLIDRWTVNVIGTFLVAAGAVYLMEKCKGHPLRFVWPFAAAALMEVDTLSGAEWLGFDYGAYGLALLLIYRYLEKHAMWMAHLALNLAYVYVFGAPLQAYSIAATFALAFVSESSGWKAYAAPRWLWRSFYPAHLYALWAVAALYPPQ